MEETNQRIFKNTPQCHQIREGLQTQVMEKRITNMTLKGNQKYKQGHNVDDTDDSKPTTTKNNDYTLGMKWLRIK